MSLNDHLYRAIVENMAHGAVLVFDDELRYVRAEGRKLLEAVGCRDLVGKRLADVVPADRLAKLEALYRSALAGEVREWETVRDGRTFQMHTSPVRDDDGKIIFGLVRVYDITHHKLIEKRLQDACARLDHAMSHAADAMWSIDRRERLLSYNPAYARLHEWLFGRAPSIGDDVDEGEGGPGGSSRTEWGSLYRRALKGERVTTVREYHRGQERRLLQLVLTPVLKAGRAKGVDVSTRDITDAQRTEEASLSDELTGLKNRRGFLAAAQRQLTGARAGGAEALLFFVDLDGMKAINDGLGHDAGDAALKETASLLRAVFRDADTVARLGGDEFVVLATCPIEHASAIETRLGGRLHALNAEPRRQYVLSFSVGVSRCAAEDARSIEDLLKEADARMYEEKRTRKARRSPSPASEALVQVRAPRVLAGG